MLLFLITLALSFFLTFLLVRIGGLAADVPNERSSHSAPTPRGGGVALLIAVPCSSLFIPGLTRSPEVVLAYVFALVMGLLGVREDRKSMSASLRLAIELAVALVVAGAGLRWPDLQAAVHALSLPDWLSVVITAVWIVWVLNLFNFMDGINGIASQQALIAAGAVALLTGSGQSAALATFAAVIAGAVLGFLPWNFPRARIFLGDSGSYFLGALVATLPIALSLRSGTLGAMHGILLIAPFFFDASITLIRRLYAGANIMTAHRSHFYQRLTDISGSHTKTTLAYAGWSLAFAGTLFISPRMAAATQLALCLALFLWFGWIARQQPHVP